MLDRKFRVLGVGSRLKILSSRPSTHTDKFGGTSNSVYAEVIGIGILEPQEILQREPFLTVECSPFSDGDSLLLASPNAAPAIAEYRECRGLSPVAPDEGALTDEQLETARQHEGTASMFGGYSPPTGFAAEILAALLEGGGRAQAQGEGEGDGEGEARAGQRECALM